jgi:N6-adenosine-specific RNA methylase IME4/ParB-like chromosome segregation protein Spo0J
MAHRRGLMSARARPAFSHHSTCSPREGGRHQQLTSDYDVTTNFSAVTLVRNPTVSVSDPEYQRFAKRAGLRCGKPQQWRMQFHPLADLFPLMQGVEFDAFAADIKARGLLRPIIVHEDKILDGRNRHRACKQAGVIPRLERYTGKDPLGFIISSNLHRWHLNESQRAMVAARLETMRQGRRGKDANLHVSRDSAAQRLAVSPRSVASAAVVHGHGTPELIRAVDGGKIPVSVAASIAMLPQAQQAKAVAEPARAKHIAKAVRRAERELEFAGGTARAAAELGNKFYGVLYADPPPFFKPYSLETGMDRAADNHYPTMSIAALHAMAPKIPAEKNCRLYLWSTVPLLPQMLELMNVWRFAYSSHMVWVKGTLDGSAVKSGTGYETFNAHELLLIGDKGDVPSPAPGEQPVSAIFAPRGRHSRKPDVFAEMIERLFPNVPKLEMFARKPRPGWDVWGNEVVVPGAAD